MENSKPYKNITRTASIYALLLMLLLSAFTAGAQTSVSATLSSDSDHILIGDHLNVRLTIKYPKDVKILWPRIQDSIGNMQFLSSGKIDTINQGAERILSQKMVVSAFDSGQYHAGPVVVYFRRPNNTGVDTLLSNEVPVMVATLPVDTTRPFKPIKGPLEVPYTWREYIAYILLAVLLLWLVVAAVLLWRKYRKQKPAVPARPKPKDPPHIWARKELKKLEDEKVWQGGDTKLYYSRLTDILRLYLEYRFGWSALESTTEEIEAEIEQYNLKNKAQDHLLKILKTADLVKFAKMAPTPDTNIGCMESAYKFIDFTEPSEEEKTKK